MNDNAKKWVAALRSGKYKQTQGQLRSDDKYCCLGVACDLAMETGVISSFIGTNLGLPKPVQDWIGLKDDFGNYRGFSSLASENDAGRTFLEIADIIENNEVNLFV